jgi:hypothetical protein
MEKNQKKENQKCPFFRVLLRKEKIAGGIIIVAIVFGLVAFLMMNYQKNKTFDKGNGDITEQAAMIENRAEDPPLNTADWQTYKIQWYGFELKYPKDWNNPLLKGAGVGSKWEYRYQFRKREVDKNNRYIGFDVVMYDVNKIKELSNTDEFPAIKNEELKNQGFCQAIEGHLGGNENYPAEQVYVGFNDNCYNFAYFYTLTRDQYVFNIVPILQEEKEKIARPEEEIIKEFPEFISASSTFNLIEIKRPKSVAANPKISAPRPVAAIKRDEKGRTVCAKKNDKPKKSKKGKKRHLDMECCLDPDEYPNPHCYYSPDKYGKYL